MRQRGDWRSVCPKLPAGRGLEPFSLRPRIYVRHPRSDWRLALQHQAVEVAPLVHVVIRVGLVDDAAVVPDHKVAVAPLLAVFGFFCVARVISSRTRSSASSSAMPTIP